MKIKSLTLHGFKSFADRTEIEFHEGVTAIVGPNGCGKSNISDAFRWVLGEQRPAAIRGARMEEAIFHGTAQRKPIHRAEVQLTLSNEDGILAVPYSQVVIGRSVLRGGESEYTLNSEACRMRDIQDLCRDTGLGANAYSIIEVAMVEKILSDRAEERRSLFEEAAEVGRYKDRRRTALRRLGLAEHDLDRLEDLLGEVRSKVRSLSRQRGRAERYRELRERRLILDVAVAGALLVGIEDRLVEVERDLVRVQEERPGQEVDLQRRETELEALGLESTRWEKERLGVAREAEDVRTRLEQLERDRLVAGERVGAARARIEAIESERSAVEGRRIEIASDLAELTQRLAEEEQSLTTLRERHDTRLAAVALLRQTRIERKRAEEAALSRLADAIRDQGSFQAEGEAARQRLAERVEELEHRHLELKRARTREKAMLEAVTGAESDHAELLRLEHTAREDRDQATESVRQKRELVRGLRDSLAAVEGKLTEQRARLAGLESALSAGRDLPPMVVALLQDLGPEDGILGSLADSIQVSSDYVAAVEAQLGKFLHAVLVRDWKAVKRVRVWLEAREERGGLLLLPCDSGPTCAATREEASVSNLLAHVKAEGQSAAWIQALLSGVDTRRSGQEFGPEGNPWVAEDGSGQDRFGAVRLGQPAAGRGVLRRRAEMEALGQQVGHLSLEREGLESQVAESVVGLDAVTKRTDRADQELREVADRAHESERQREDASTRLATIRESIAEIEARITKLKGALLEVEERGKTGDAHLKGLRSQREKAESELARQREQALAATSDWETANFELHELQLELARSETELEALRDRRDHVRGVNGELEERHARLDEELRALEKAVLSGSGKVERVGEELGGLLARRTELQQKLVVLSADLEERRSAQQELEAAVRVARRDEREHSDRRHSLELELADLRGKRRSIHERVEVEWESPFAEIQTRAERPEAGGPAEWSAELDAVRERLSRLGPVNLLAEREYEEEKERLDFLDAQRADLSQARDDLHRTIRQVNQEASAAFMEVFNQVRQNFQNIYARLFDGGKGDVWLEDPDSPLDSAIEITASPGGKRTQRIHLLSGGEKALTALSLVFAIYLAKPSPFCILDEVDAPLDETNIGRFTAMLDEFKQDTQFLVITHNPRTVEAADWIYGVTMQEAGVTSVVSLGLQELPSGQVA